MKHLMKVTSKEETAARLGNMVDGVWTTRVTGPLLGLGVARDFMA